MAARVYKLVTGEEVIGQPENLDLSNADGPATAINLKKVRTITRLSMQTPQGVTFVNVLANYWASSPSDNLLLKVEHIVAHCEPEMELERTYTRDTCGIELSSSMPKGRA